MTIWSLLSRRRCVMLSGLLKQQSHLTKRPFVCVTHWLYVNTGLGQWVWRFYIECYVYIISEIRAGKDTDWIWWNQAIQSWTIIYWIISLSAMNHWSYAMYTTGSWEDTFRNDMYSSNLFILIKYIPVTWWNGQQAKTLYCFKMFHTSVKLRL